MHSEIGWCVATRGLYLLGRFFLNYCNFVGATQVSPEEIPSASSKRVFTWWSLVLYCWSGCLECCFWSRWGSVQGPFEHPLAGGGYGCGCSRVGLWIFPSMANCRLFDICHYTSEAGINRGGVKIPSQFGFLYLLLILSPGLGTSCRLCFNQ